MQHHLSYALPFSHPQPRPRFCIFRPGGLLAPLIPIDELPSWLQICNWTPDMFMGLQPVSLSYIPREGEYDVICHHCSSSVDSLHQSISERNEDSPQSTSSQTKSCPGAFITGPVVEGSPALPKVPPGVPCQILGQPPFHAALQNPFLGLYMLGMPGMPASVAEPVPVQKPPSSVASRSSSTESVHSEVHESLVGLHKTRSDTPATSIDLGEPDTLPDLSPDTQKKISQAIAASLCSVSAAGSIASTRSLTAMVEQLRQRMAEREHASKSARPCVRLSEASFKSSPAQTTSKKPQSWARRRTKGRRRRAAKKKSAVSKTYPAPAVEKPEQVNSSTKRRDRRERMNHQHNESNSGGQYWHMMMIPGGSGAPHR
ncbi:hypothetical protein N7492_006520 [Penicillium capsulatum]|uniref:Uncharacterized protein n=1 Tax=Penicillium capsulatum TaxID=69766 RepID=A0A9W9I0D8_9EURO|nr:hypothetical protein N7492_006520 [Penicillium capsulatum]KAJ6116356.1 hypothetical protein N7512_006081 [Penicillium capsulatum]